MHRTDDVKEHGHMHAHRIHIDKCVFVSAFDSAVMYFTVFIVIERAMVRLTWNIVIGSLLARYWKQQ